MPSGQLMKPLLRTLDLCARSKEDKGGQQWFRVNNVCLTQKNSAEESARLKTCPR
jgi:hypothetical protein